MESVAEFCTLYGLSRRMKVTTGRDISSAVVFGKITVVIFVMDLYHRTLRVLRCIFSDFAIVVQEQLCHVVRFTSRLRASSIDLLEKPIHIVR